MNIDNLEENEHMEKFSAMLRQSLAEEHEAAANYTKRAAKCEKHDLKDAAELFRSIAEEEVVHAGEFQALMEKYGLLNQDALNQGNQEAQEILSGEEVEPEIDSDAVPADDVENESVNEEFLDKGALEQRMLQIFDYNQEDYKAVELLKMITRFMDVDQLQKFYEYVQEEMDINYDEVFKSSNESRGRENPAVSVYKKGVGNMSYPAKNMRDAIAYVKKQNLDLENGDYFDIHTGMNTSEPDCLDFWSGTGTGYWRNVLNNPRTKDKEKQIILDREIKSMEDLHESLCNKNQNAKTKNEGWNEDIFQYLVDYADREGLNVADLAEYDPAEIADWISDRSGFPVDAEDVDNMIEYEIGNAEQLRDEDVASAGTVASLGSAPTVVAGKDTVEVEPTKICEELKNLQDLLK